uniref:Zinc finger MYM-type protein 1-like n=1 Tax=Ciona intestinalis TaxID=7719 RepID=H2XRJ7_CIOIN
WLSYDVGKDKAFCTICKWAVTNKHVLLTWAIDGYSNWKKGKSGVVKHNESKSHRDNATTKNVCDGRSSTSLLVSKKSYTKMQQNRKALDAIFSTMLLLARQGLAVRGHTDERSNLHAVMGLLAKYNLDISRWLNQSSFTWLSHGTTNEILDTLGSSVLNEIVNPIKKAKYFSIIADETTDLSVSTQLSLCIRFVNCDFTVNEHLVDLAVCPSTTAESLHQLLTKAVISLGLDLSDCRGQGYDGAATMSGMVSGVQARFKQTYPAMLFVHCIGHQLNLAVQDSLKYLRQGTHALSILENTVNFINASPKRLNNFREFKASSDATSTSLRPLCPTRWVMRLPAIDAFLKQFSVVLDWLETISSDTTIDPVTRNKASSHLMSLEKFEVYFMLRIFQKLLTIINPIHVAIQKRGISIGQVRSLIEQLLSTLFASVEDRQQAIDFFLVCERSAAQMGVQTPVLPRGVGRRTARIQATNHDDGTGGSIIELYSTLHCNIFQKAAAAIISRYCMPDLAVVSYIEEVLLHKHSDEAMAKICTLYQQDFNAAHLHVEQVQLKSYTAHKNLSISGIEDLRSLFASNESLAIMMPNISNLLKIYMTIPCTTCEAERCFSTLRRIKNYLRTTMTQNRLKNLVLLNVHQAEAAHLNLVPIVNSWIDQATVRKNTF